jgi:hypothetical protein
MLAVESIKTSHIRTTPLVTISAKESTLNPADQTFNNRAKKPSKNLKDSKTYKIKAISEI